MTDIAGLTEDAYSTAVKTAIDTVRGKHPDLDLRSGTAVRALVIEPGALLDAAQRDTVSRLRTAMSLSAMSREATVPREDAEAVLSNFGITLGGGTKASGLVRINLTSHNSVTIRAGVVFTTESGASFVVTANTSAAVVPADGETRIVSSDDGTYYFTAPVEASDVGTVGNVKQGTAFSTSVMIANYLSSEAFSDFSGGEDGESVASAVARIPSALAYRGMTNAVSVRARLSSSLQDPAALRGVSCVGHRDRAQLRDKHNLLGVSVGGRVDVYARLFDAPGVVSFIAEGTLVDTTSRKYRIDIPDYPGFYAVKHVGPADQPDRLGSLQYELVRGTTEGAADEHDFYVTDKDHCETAWSAYQTGYILAYGNYDSDDVDHLSAMSSTPPEKAQFKVDLFWTDGIRMLQGIVDDPAVRNTAADYVVRSPAICLVSVNAYVRMKDGASVTREDIEKAVSAYINGCSFTGRLTRSELANVMIQHGAASVDMSASGMYLGGRICGADGIWYLIDGDSLDIDGTGPERAMLTAGTTVFAAEPGSVQVNIL